MYTESKNGWVTNGIGEGSWIKIEFHQIIQISKIVYQHNDYLTTKCCNQYFKDISFQFSDGTGGNVTVEDGSLNFEANDEFHYRIIPPKPSSYLLLMANSIYNHTRPSTDFEKKESLRRNVVYEESRFGVRSIRLRGEIEAGKV